MLRQHYHNNFYMNEEQIDISFGAIESVKDARTIQSGDMASDAQIPKEGKVPLDYDCVNDLCNQRKIGMCTMCGVRMAVEATLKDGVRLHEAWGYIMGKVLYDDPLYGAHFEGSSALTMLKVANRYGIPEKKFGDMFELKLDGTYKEFWDHFQSHYNGIIPKEIFDNATKHKISGYYSVDTTPAMIAKEIQKGKVVVTRFAVGENTYTKKDGTYSKKAKDLLPLRAPSPVTGGHIWDINQYWAFGLELGGPNSWSRDWCADNTKQEPGYWWFDYYVQKPYFTEAWAIMDTEDKFVFKKPMKLGSQGPHVVALQKVLVKEVLLTMPVNVPFGIFAQRTKQAVIAYQEKYAEEILKPLGLTKGTGTVGEMTIKHLNRFINF